jgi:mRNA interferase MazF
MAFLRGDVVLVPFPFTNLAATKVRPAVVLSGALYQSAEPDVILGAITSNLSAATGPFDYVIQDWQTAGLRLPSAFKLVLATLEQRRVVYRIGALTTNDFLEIEKRLRQSLEV